MTEVFCKAFVSLVLTCLAKNKSALLGENTISVLRFFGAEYSFAIVSACFCGGMANCDTAWQVGRSNYKHGYGAFSNILVLKCIY